MDGEGTAPQLIVVIGANGSGKTTWTEANPDKIPDSFHNADSIAGDLGDANNHEYQLQARRMVDERIQRDFEARRSFGFESTYSGDSRPALVMRARELGYVTIGVFVGTMDPEINKDRVRKRVQEGGHDIPESEIVRRWTAAQKNLLKTWIHFDEITLVDNSGTWPVMVATKTGNRQGMVGNGKDVPAWVKQLLLRAGAGS